MVKLNKKILSVLLCFFLLSAFTSIEGHAASVPRIKVQFYSSKIEYHQQINAEFNLINTSTSNIPLKDITIRYYYTLNAPPNNQEIGAWYPFDTGAVTFKFIKMTKPVPTADYYLEIGFTDAAGTILPGDNVEVYTWFNNAGWADTYDQSDDYSMNPADEEFVDWERTPAYIKGVLEWGKEPDAASKPVDPPIVNYTEGSPVNIKIDAKANVHSISPEIYGMSFAKPYMITELNLPVNRSGGNSQSRYNWKVDATNRASDWYFESLPEDSDNPSALPNGSSTDVFYENNKVAGAKTMLTIPMLKYVAKDRVRRSSFSIQKYGEQQDRDYAWFPDAGNGVRPDGTRITNNDPLDAHIAVDEKYMGEWVSHLKTKYKSAAEGGVNYYLLDNEPGLWYETHRDVVKNAPHDDELIATSIKYSNTIKNIDPTAKVAGYEDWGWLALRLSPYDMQHAATTNDWSSFPDQNTHGYSFFAEYYLKKMSEAEKIYGKRLLDVFTTHIYPQSGEYSSNESKAMQALRMRSTRILWDKNYTDESWQQAQIYLIPRMREWVNQYYPGTKTGITEYNWGSLEYPDGGIAQADILGIFGREGLDIGTLWTTVEKDTPGYNAFKIFRNYDGNNSTFGDKSIQCIVPNPDQLSSFASLDSKTGEMKVIMMNKLPTTITPANLAISNFINGRNAEVYQWAGKGKLSKLENITMGNQSAQISLPPYSATLLVIKPAVNEAAIDINMDGKIDLLDLMQAALRYNRKSSDSNWNSACDINKDNIIDIFDMIYILKRME